MDDRTLLERMLRHDRALVIGGLALLVSLSWAYLILGLDAGDEKMAGMVMPMSVMPWTLDRWGLMLSMWLVMMAAMMLPSAAPMVLLYARVARSRSTEGSPANGTITFVLGYAAVWGGFSVGAVLLQSWLEELALLSPRLELTSLVLAASVLIAAGAYQWTPWKHACLQRCRSPLDFVLTHWRSGAGGAFIMGIRHGLYCVGCCGLIMLLLFVGGIMNLYWIGLLAALVLGEKLLPGGQWLSRLAGVALIGWGVAALLHLGLPV
jgi:predicted metal-binding membrane protein